MYGVLWDMIADKDLNILQENKSVQAAPEVVTRIWQKAAELGYSKYFIAEVGQDVIDDHVPFIERGMRVADVIDYDYGPPAPGGGSSPSYHHTLGDTMEHISKQSLQIVGDVALALITQG
jgi:hypothetical protein